MRRSSDSNVWSLIQVPYLFLSGTIADFWLTTSALIALTLHPFSASFLAFCILLGFAGIILVISVTTLPANARNAFELFEYSLDHQGEKFELTTFNELLRSAYLASNPSSISAEDVNVFIRRFLPALLHLRIIRKNIVVASNVEEASTIRDATVRAYCTGVSGWIILPYRVSEMSGVNFYMLAHELGHSGFSGLVLGFKSRLSLIGPCVFAVMTLPFVSPKVFPFLLLSIAFTELSTLLMIRAIRPIKLAYEEIMADCHAFSCSPKSWLNGAMERDLANYLCSTTGDSQHHIAVRKRMFVSNLRRIRKGLSPTTTNRAFDRLTTPIWRWLYIEKACKLITAIVAAIGIQQASWLNFLTLSFIIFCLCFIWLFAALIIRVIEYMAARDLRLCEENSNHETSRTTVLPLAMAIARFRKSRKRAAP